MYCTLHNTICDADVVLFKQIACIYERARKARTRLRVCLTDPSQIGLTILVKHAYKNASISSIITSSYVLISLSSFASSK